MMAGKPTYEELEQRVKKLEKAESERSRAEKALRESEEKYRQLFNTVSDTVLVFDAETREFIDANNAATTLYGYSKEEFFKLKHSDITCEPKKSDETIKQTISGEICRIPLRYHKKKDGTKFPVEISSGAFKLGNRHMVCGVARDITDRMEIDQALQVRKDELEKRLKELNCLYGISNLIEQQDISLEEILQGTVDLIPPSWQYPEITCARIIIQDREWKTKNFQETIWKQASDIKVHSELSGNLEVYYLEEKPKIDEGPFLIEERNLINTITRLTGRIVERKQGEEALRANEEKYRNIFENIQDVYYEVNLDGIILEISPAIEEISKYSREELIGTSVYNLYVYPEKRDEFVKELLKKGKVSDYGIILKDKDGPQKYCSIYAKLSNEENGVPQKIIASIRDVTQRKQMENALRESEAQKTALLDAAIDRIRYVDTDMKIIWANKTAVDASGMAPEDLVGKTCYQLFVGRNTPCEGCPTLRSKETGRIERKVMHQPKAKGISGESYWDTYCVPLKNEAGNSESFIQIARNITEQIRAKEQIHDLTHDLMNAQESERQMISRELHDSVAQELATVKIDCETLFNHQPAIHPEIRRRISEISRTLQKSIEIVRNLSYDLRPPALDELGLDQALFQYCDDFSEDNGINVDFHSAGLKDLKLDIDTEINLYRIVQEGLTNIKKHAGADHVTIRLVAAFPTIILRIKDNGRGFDVQERLASITKEKRMGIRSIEERVKLLKGKMEIQSKPNQGSKISIKFPYKEKKHGS